MGGQAPDISGTEPEQQNDSSETRTDETVAPEQKSEEPKPVEQPSGDAE